MFLPIQEHITGTRQAPEIIVSEIKRSTVGYCLMQNHKCTCMLEHFYQCPKEVLFLSYIYFDICKCFQFVPV